MSVDFIPLNSADFQWIIDLARERGDGAESWGLEIKGPLDLSKRDARAKIAKFILGMANRLPSQAQQHFQGWGVMLIGVADGQAVGMEDVLEEHDVREGVQIALGDPTPQWDLVRHPVSETNSCVFIRVAPPREGDPVFVSHQKFPQEGLRDGGIYVRSATQTREANAAEIKALIARYTADTGPAVDLDLTFSAPALRVTDRDWVADKLVENRLVELRKPREEPDPISAAAARSLLRYPGSALDTEELSQEEREERAESEIRERWQERFPMLVATVGPHCYPSLVNRADGHLDEVELTITLPGVFAHEGFERDKVADWEVDPIASRHTGFYEEPAPARISMPGRGNCPMSWENDNGTCTVTLTPRLLPMRIRRQPNTPLVLESLDPQATTITAQWQLVARNLPKVLTGTTSIPVEQRDAAHLYVGYRKPEVLEAEAQEQ